MSEIRDILEALQQGPKRSLGQNFLLDKNLASWVVRQLKPEEGDLVIEVGPGLGALTEWLVKTPAQVAVIEKDTGLAEYLKQRFENLEVYVGDALQFDLRQLFRGLRVKLIGNLPYNISTALLSHFTNDLSPVEQAVVTVQKEVADRLVAKPGTKDYGAYTVLLQHRWKIRLLKTLQPALFFPRPKVASATVLVERRHAGEVLACDTQRLEECVRKGFSERRKKLRKLLGIEPSQWKAICAQIQIDEDVRAEALSLNQWVNLVQATSVTKLHQNEEIFDVVDENDIVIGQIPRAEVHRSSLRHRASHILIRNRAGELFLQRRARWKDLNPDVWDSSAAGHLMSGESYEASAQRELQEELGIQCTVTPIGKLPCSDITGNEFVMVFVGEHEGPFQLQATEVAAGAFFPISQIQTWIARRPQDFSPVFIECLALYQRA